MSGVKHRQWPVLVTPRPIAVRPLAPAPPPPPDPKLYLLQEHPGLRGTPLAMLAAQCNKLSSMSPPPLADAAVGKGFHPWKKSGGGSPESAPSQARQPHSSAPSNSSNTNNAFSPSPQQATSPSPAYGENPPQYESLLVYGR